MGSLSFDGSSDGMNVVGVKLALFSGTDVVLQPVLMGVTHFVDAAALVGAEVGLGLVLFVSSIVGEGWWLEAEGIALVNDVARDVVLVPSVGTFVGVAVGNVFVLVLLIPSTWISITNLFKSISPLPLMVNFMPTTTKKNCWLLKDQLKFRIILGSDFHFRGQKVYAMHFRLEYHEAKK